MSYSRLEKFIYAICSMEVSDLPAPLSRIEILWNCLITGETPDFEPLSRNEKYLMAMLDRYDISNLPAPMSRGEQLLYKIAVGETDLSDVPGYLSRYEELLKYLIENGGISGGDFEYVLYTLNQSLSTLYQTVEKPVKSAILKGNTKYRDIDTGDILDTFDETKNLELVSVKMPVLTTTGKNLFNGILLEQWSSTSGAISNNSKTRMIKMKVKPNTTYVVTRTESGNRLDVIMFASEPMLGANTAVGTALNAGSNTTATSFTTTNDTSWIIIRAIDNIDNYTSSVDFQVEEGFTATSYEPYKTNILTVNEEVELRGIGDAQDELNLLTGELIERIGEITFDGSDDETWARNGTLSNNYETSFFTLSVDNVKRSTGHITKICDKLPVLADYSHAEDVEGVTQVIDNQMSIRVLKTSLSDDSVEGLKAYLQSNPITVQYQFITKSVKTVDLTTVDQDGQPTKLKTFNDISYVEINADNLIPSVDVEVATKISETLSTLGLEHHDISDTQNKLGQTIDEQSENTDATMMATTEIYEQTL